MDATVDDLHGAFMHTGNLIADVYQARNIFFEEELRGQLEKAYKEFEERFLEILERIGSPEVLQEYDLISAGLDGAQRDLKLKSFEVSYNAYRSNGSIRRLIEALKKGKIIISSLGGVVPFIGSFVQEFVEFLLRQLERES